MNKWWIVLWCIGEKRIGLVIYFITNIESVYYLLLLNTLFLLRINNKETLIRYCNTSLFVVVIHNGKTETLCSPFIKYCHIFTVIISSSLLLFAYCCFCWRLGFGTSSLKLSASASCCCHFFIIGGSGVTSCGCVCWLLWLVGGGDLLLLSAAASPLSKLTFHFVHKF